MGALFLLPAVYLFYLLTRIRVRALPGVKTSSARSRFCGSGIFARNSSEIKLDGER